MTYFAATRPLFNVSLALKKKKKAVKRYISAWAQIVSLSGFSMQSPKVYLDWNIAPKMLYIADKLFKKRIILTTHKTNIQ